MFGDGIAIATGMTGVCHEVGHFLFSALPPQTADMQPMPCRIFTLGFHGF